MADNEDRATNWGDISNEDRVFFTASLEKAMHYSSKAASEQGGEPLIIRLSVPDKSKLVPDYDAQVAMQKSMTQGKMDPEYMKNMSRSDYTVKSRNRRSDYHGAATKRFSDDIGKWGYKGRIPSKFFHEFYIPEFHHSGAVEPYELEQSDYRANSRENMKAYLFTVEEMGYEYGDPDFDLGSHKTDQAEMEKYGWYGERGYDYAEFEEWMYDNDGYKKWELWKKMPEDVRDDYYDFFDFAENYSSEGGDGPLYESERKVTTGVLLESFKSFRGW
jgi:hypothetical protein